MPRRACTANAAVKAMPLKDGFKITNYNYITNFFKKHLFKLIFL